MRIPPSPPPLCLPSVLQLVPSQWAGQWMRFSSAGIRPSVSLPTSSWLKVRAVRGLTSSMPRPALPAEWQGNVSLFTCVCVQYSPQANFKAWQEGIHVVWVEPVATSKPMDDSYSHTKKETPYWRLVSRHALGMLGRTLYMVYNIHCMIYSVHVHVCICVHVFKFRGFI